MPVACALHVACALRVIYTGGMCTGCGVQVACAQRVVYSTGAFDRSSPSSPHPPTLTWQVPGQPLVVPLHSTDADEDEPSNNWTYSPSFAPHTFAEVHAFTDSLRAFTHAPLLTHLCPRTVADWLC